MEKEVFEKNLQKIYDLSVKLDKDLSKYYNGVEKTGFYQDFLDEFLEENNIKINKESRLAVASRLINLKFESMKQFLKRENYSNKEIEKIKFKSYSWVKDFYEDRHFKFISAIKKNKLTTDFYLAVLNGVANVGIEFNKLQPKWVDYIINNINNGLENKFNSNQEKIMNFLESNNLIDLGHNGELADRTYSALIKINASDSDKKYEDTNKISKTDDKREDDNKDCKYKSASYMEVFENEVSFIIDELKKFKNKLSRINDDVYNQKKAYVEYLKALINAFSERDVNMLVKKWAIVDEKWMSITSPFQIGHPLEYYHDHYRKAVQLEWDVRLLNPSFAKNTRAEKINLMFEEMFEKFDKDKFNSVYKYSLKNLNKVQLYIGKPILYYGAELEGLFSAQVVPNDTIVSEQFGKKIFAFADFILEISRNRPMMKLPLLTFEKDFVKKSREFLFNETKKWHELYDIETIGHEYGHVLWLDEDSEIYMNKTGNFKNIEEFKATTGGLVSFFLNPENENLKKDLVYSLIKRAVGLIAWQEVGQVRPYYCEGLIHLNILFESKMIEFNEDLIKVNYNEDNYLKLKEKYLEVYSNLAKHYLEKKDASEFLFKYVKVVDSIYLPNNDFEEKFVKWYYDLYKKYANELDDENLKEDYIRE